MIIAVCGLPGSGKSYFGEKLAGRIGAAYLSSDRMRKSILTESKYTPEEKESVYQVLFENMKNLIKQGEDVVVDATFHRRDRRQSLIKYSALAPITFIEIHAEEEIMKQRLSRSRSFSDADFSVYEKLKGNADPIDHPHLKLLSTNSNIEQMLSEACGYLKPFLHETTGD